MQGVKKILNSENSQNIFDDTGLNISVSQYQAFRYLILTMLLILSVIAQLNHDQINYKHMISIAILYMIAEPVEKVFHYPTPFGFVIKFLKLEYKQKKDFELFTAIMQLKNIAIATKDKPLGTDFIIQQLMLFTKITKPIFSKMIYLWRSGQEQKACEYFAEAIGTKLGSDLSNVFLKLRKMNPIEMQQQLVLYQESVKEEKRTEKLNRQENISHLIYAPIIASALIVLVNFVIVVLYIDQMQNLLGF